MDWVQLSDTGSHSETHIHIVIVTEWLTQWLSESVNHPTTTQSVAQWPSNWVTGRVSTDWEWEWDSDWEWECVHERSEWLPEWVTQSHQWPCDASELLTITVTHPSGCQCDWLSLLLLLTQSLTESVTQSQSRQSLTLSAVTLSLTEYWPGVVTLGWHRLKFARL